MDDANKRERNYHYGATFDSLLFVSPLLRTPPQFQHPLSSFTEQNPLFSLYTRFLILIWKLGFTWDLVIFEIGISSPPLPTARSPSPQLRFQNAAQLPLREPEPHHPPSNQPQKSAYPYPLTLSSPRSGE